MNSDHSCSAGNKGKREREDVSQGECRDTKRTWICSKCGTENQEEYKFCMECSGRNPKRSIEEIASASGEPPAYRRRIEEEENENRRKRKAEEGSMQQEEIEGRVKSRTSEEEKDRRTQEDASKGSLKKEGGETRGDIDKTMNVDMMEEEEFQERKKDLRENKIPLIMLQGAH